MNTKKHFKKTLLIAAAVAAVVFIFACTGGIKKVVQQEVSPMLRKNF